MNSWETLSQALSERITKENFERWFGTSTLCSETDEEIHISVPNRFSKDWIESHYGEEIESALNSMQVRKRVLFSVVPMEHAGPPVFAPEPSYKGPAVVSVPSGKRRETFLNPRFIFENFVVGSSNQFAHAAARAVADKPSEAYNPLFIYGGVGLGKTHLMHAVGHQLLSTNHRIKICFISTESFMNEMITCIRYDRMPEFREKYRNMDVLMVDDIQFLSDKERTQEEFFHTFNALFDSHKQLVFSSDRYPKEIQNLEERLRSRFEWGLLADIHPPDLETKVAILRKKAEIDGIRLPDEVNLFLAEKIRSNVRELEGSLIKLGAYASLSGQEITVDLAKEVLKDFLDQKDTVVTIEAIQKKVAAHFNLRPAELKSKRRTHSVVFPRQVAMYLCRKLTEKSLPEIGRAFGGKDHTTVIHAIKTIENQLREDSDLEKTLKRLSDEILST